MSMALGIAGVVIYAMIIIVLALMAFLLPFL